MGGKTGGETTQVIQPAPPPQPSTADAIREYVASLPALFQAQLDFAPQEAQQQLDLIQQFGLPIGQAVQDIQSQLFPETSAIQEELAAEARRGIQEGAPESVRNRFRDIYAANLGTNAGSPIGAEGTARSLVELDELFRQQSRNLGLSLAGRQPLAQPGQPSFTNQLNSFSPGQALDFQAQNFGTFAAADRPLLGQNSFGRRTAFQDIGAILPKASFSF